MLSAPDMIQADPLPSTVAAVASVGPDTKLAEPLATVPPPVTCISLPSLTLSVPATFQRDPGPSIRATPCTLVELPTTAGPVDNCCPPEICRLPPRRYPIPNA